MRSAEASLNEALSLAAVGVRGKEPACESVRIHNTEIFRRTVSWVHALASSHDDIPRGLCLPCFSEKR